MVPADHSVDPVRWQGNSMGCWAGSRRFPTRVRPRAARVVMSAGPAARPTPVATLVTGGREAAGGVAHLSGREAAADTNMATYTGHWPSGRRSFRKQRTVNPPIVPARYNFLCSFSRPAL